jgi:hypothetical protein
MSNNPYVALLKSIYEFDGRYTDSITTILTEEDRNAIQLAIDSLEKKTGGERMRFIIHQSFGFKNKSKTLAEIGRILEPPVTGSRVRELRRKAERYISEMPAIRPVIEKITLAGIEGYHYRVEITLSLPTPAQLESLRVSGSMPATAAQKFSGTFLTDCFPECIKEKPCPTCRARTFLLERGILAEVVDFAKEWQDGPSDDWSSVLVSSLDFSVRTSNSMKYGGIKTLGQLCKQKKYELLRLPNFGRKSLNEIEEFLKSIGKTLEL